jgi:hypothetical protein
MNGRVVAFRTRGPSKWKLARVDLSDTRIRYRPAGSLLTDPVVGEPSVTRPVGATDAVNFTVAAPAKPAVHAKAAKADKKTIRTIWRFIFPPR